MLSLVYLGGVLVLAFLALLSGKRRFALAVVAVSLLSTLGLLHQAQATLPGFEAPRVGAQPISVNGATLRRVRDVSLPDAPSGTPLNYPYGGSRGAFWWKGRGTLIVAVDQPDTYLLRITTYNSKPPPVELAFGVSGAATWESNVKISPRTGLVGRSPPKNVCSSHRCAAQPRGWLK